MSSLHFFFAMGSDVSILKAPLAAAISPYVNKVYETGPPVYRPYPRRLESLIICRYHYKDSTFSSVILRP